ncbi:MAG: RNA polymerase-binding protein DksA [Deltaproteobacteria bacterium RIFCSPHIGHO2_12_FULL_43_9]|nr:MAG: RNA polymerase-binding protein DksA [Deltaproteobacteria bacterium RIFCSPHIGHO2_12_FULL_43_9]
MNKKTLDRFQAILLEQRRRLLQSSEKSKEEDLQLSVDDLPDEIDHASAEINQSVIFRLRDRERVLLQKIEHALKKIENGDFGVCEECGDEISAKRLEARPVTTLCIKCKETQEIKEKIYA